MLKKNVLMRIKYSYLVSSSSLSDEKILLILQIINQATTPDKAAPINAPNASIVFYI